MNKTSEQDNYLKGWFTTPMGELWNSRLITEMIAFIPVYYKFVKIIVIGTIIVRGNLIHNYYHSTLKYLSPFLMIYFFYLQLKPIVYLQRTPDERLLWFGVLSTQPRLIKCCVLKAVNMVQMMFEINLMLDLHRLSLMLDNLLAGWDIEKIIIS